jgi:hypothetical protein
VSDDNHAHASSPAGGKIRPDDTPPQNAVIFAAAVLSVLALFGLKYVFDSYMDRSEVRVRAMHVSASHASEVLTEYRQHAALELNGGEMPVSEAMEQLAERGRGAFVQIRPVADTTTGAREGWARMPVVAPEPPPRADPRGE